MKILFLTRTSKQSDLHRIDDFYYYAWAAWNDIDHHRHTAYITTSKPNEIDFAQYDLVVSWMYPHILRERHLDAPRYGVVNNHISALPRQRGSYPNVFAILDGERYSGATIHIMDTGIDTGNILAQKYVDISPIDTGQSLYHKLERCAYDLWHEYWPVLESLLESTGELPHGIEQEEADATRYRKSHVDSYDDLETYLGNDNDIEILHDVVNIIRARTFPPYKGAYIRDDDGRKIYLELKLRYADDE